MMKTLIRLTWEALFLSEGPYAEMHGDSNPMLRGLVLVILIALAVALAGLVGTRLTKGRPRSPNGVAARRQLTSGDVGAVGAQPPRRRPDEQSCLAGLLRNDSSWDRPSPADD